MRRLPVVQSLSLCLALALLAVGGCQSRTKTAQAPPPEPARAAPAPAPHTPGRGVVFLPTGDRHTSVLMIERSAPMEVVLGQPFEYEIKATNLTHNAVSGVIISDQCARNFKLDSATPAQDSADAGMLRWNLGVIQPQASKTIRVRGQATSTEAVQHCLSANWDMTSCMAINVVQPALRLTMTATEDALKCDPIALRYVVTNSGTGEARNVMIRQTLPRGLTTTDGKDTIAVAAGNLMAGQSKQATINLTANATGRFEHQAQATADGELKSQATAATVLHEPVLAITCNAPEQQFIGRAFTYEATLTNNGDGVARQTVLEMTLPAGVSMTSATMGGVPSPGRVTWNLGELAPKASRKVAFTASTSAEGQYTTTATARAFCAQAVSASKQTSVVGIAAVLLEMVDVHDPIEIGQNETYRITVTNQGSAVDTNIRIVATLEDTMEFVSASGVTRGTHANRVVTFASLPTLAPGAKAEWTVIVKAIKEGDVRFKVEMNTDQLTRPVTKTEATNFYR